MYGTTSIDANLIGRSTSKSLLSTLQCNFRQKKSNYPLQPHPTHTHTQVEQNRPYRLASEPLRQQLSPHTHRSRFERSSMIIKYLAVLFDLPHAQRKLLWLVIVVAIDSTVDGQVWEYILQKWSCEVRFWLFPSFCQPYRFTPTVIIRER